MQEILGTSHISPLYPCGHSQWYRVPIWLQDPPFTHGFGLHRSIISWN